MKKILALVLALSLIATFALAAVSCQKETPADNENVDGGEQMDETVEDPADELPEEDLTEKPAAPGSSAFIQRTKVSVDGTPVFHDGKLEVHFTEAFSFDENTVCYIGLLAHGNADSYKATVDPASFDFAGEDGGYTAAVLVCDTAIEPDTYTIHVTIGDCIVDPFTLTID